MGKIKRPNTIWNIIFFIIAILIPSISFADILVSQDGGGDYSSFTQAVYETVYSKETIVVFPGIYDIHAEYEELFDDVTDLRYNNDIGNNFQLGIMLYDRKVFFMPGAKLVCVWDQPADGEHLFCPIYAHSNVVLSGMDLYAEGMLYAVHDDVWNYNDPYINEYYQCRIIGKLLKGANCIGGGCGKYSRHIIDRCYFDNGVDDSLTVRYHNNPFPDSMGDIWITNSWFNGSLGLCYCGDSSNNINVYVDSCKAVAIKFIHETQDSAENIDLYEWQNEISK